VKIPCDRWSVNCTPALAADPPVSCHTAWDSGLTITSSPGPREHAQGHLIGHRAARKPQRRFLAEQCRHALLQQVGSRVLAVLVVAHGRAAIAARIASRAG
jgi:hypothetical protein